MVEYDTPMKGQRYIQETKQQIQEDVTTLMDGCYGLTHDDLTDKLCQIVVDNFKKLEE